MTCYLIHFDRPLGHAQHYLGYARDVSARLADHRAGYGARLMQVVAEQGITWRLARTWPQGDRTLERRLKRWHKSCQLCPICREEQP